MFCHDKENEGDSCLLFGFSINFSMTLLAIWSVSCKSLGKPEAQTQLKESRTKTKQLTFSYYLSIRIKALTEKDQSPMKIRLPSRLGRKMDIWIEYTVRRQFHQHQHLSRKQKVFKGKSKTNQTSALRSQEKSISIVEEIKTTSMKFIDCDYLTSNTRILIQFNQTLSTETQKSIGRLLRTFDEQVLDIGLDFLWGVVELRHKSTN